MLYTDNLNLKKPEQTEYYNVDDFNYNADILDEKFGNISNDVDSIKENYVVKTDVIPISQGGTGATTASQACANIGALPTSGGGTVKSTINSNQNVVIAGNCELYKDVDNQGFEICGGTVNKTNDEIIYNGARLLLNGKDCGDGEFGLFNKNDIGLTSHVENLFWNNTSLIIKATVVYEAPVTLGQGSNGLTVAIPSDRKKHLLYKLENAWPTATWNGGACVTISKENNDGVVLTTNVAQAYSIKIVELYV